MKTPLPSSAHPVAPPRHRRRRAFSLVEVTLALGIVTFGLVGVVGVLPTALASGRQSFDQNRAAAIANTLLASFRSQPFQKVGYLDAQFDEDGKAKATPDIPTLDLNSQKQTDESGASVDVISFYVSFLEGVTVDANDADTFGERRRLRFVSGRTYAQQPPPPGANYLVTLRCNNRPDGMAITPVPSSPPGGLPTVPAQANQIELDIAAVSKPLNQYRFVSTVANRLN